MPRFPHKQRVFSPSPVLSRLIPSFSNTLSPYNQVLDSQGNETNYYYCELDRSIYIAHTTVPGDPQSTDYVVRLAGENDGV